MGASNKAAMSSTGLHEARIRQLEEDLRITNMERDRLLDQRIEDKVRAEVYKEVLLTVLERMLDV